MIIDPDAFSNVYFIPGAYPFGPKFADRIVEDAEKLTVEFALIIIDTQAAFFPGDDENSNTQIGEFFRVVRRKMTMLHGGPAVIVLCHPTKNAGNDNLIHEAVVRPWPRSTETSPLSRRNGSSQSIRKANSAVRTSRQSSSSLKHGG